MIKIVTAIGGLGNQMFCYAFYKKLKSEFPNIEFRMDLSDIWDNRFENNMELYASFPNLRIDEATSKEIWKSEGKLVNYYRGPASKLVRKFVDKCNTFTMKNKRNKAYTEEQYMKKPMLTETDIENINYFDGFWQNIDFYIPYLEELQKNDFKYAEIKDKCNQEIAEKIASTNAVSLHIRRGDYVGESLDILTTKYYEKIIRHIMETEENPHFYIFSNDSDYIEREYQWLDNKTIVKNNLEIQSSFRDMQLMSLCRINVIANSTFSIWAALLNQNQDKKVFYPDHYYVGIEMQEIHLKGFYRIPI